VIRIRKRSSWLFHGLEQGGLGLRRRPVDLVTQHQVGKDRPAPELEGAVGPVVHGDAGDVGRQEVGGELDPPPGAVEAGGERLRQRGLAHARDVFHEEVAFGHQADECESYGLVLALDCGRDVVDDALEAVGERLNCASDGP
jgi:hypothetical protein